MQNCVAKIAFEMSIKDELLLKYRHVNLRSLQLGPSTMLKVHLTDIISPPIGINVKLSTLSSCIFAALPSLLDGQVS